MVSSASCLCMPIKVFAIGRSHCVCPELCTKYIMFCVTERTGHQLTGRVTGVARPSLLYVIACAKVGPGSGGVRFGGDDGCR